MPGTKKKCGTIPQSGLTTYIRLTAGTYQAQYFMPERVMIDCLLVDQVLYILIYSNYSITK